MNWARKACCSEMHWSSRVCLSVMKLSKEEFAGFHAEECWHLLDQLLEPVQGHARPCIWRVRSLNRKKPKSWLHIFLKEKGIFCWISLATHSLKISMTDSHTSCCTTLIPLFHTEDFKEIFPWYLVYLINISLYSIIVFASRRALTVLQKLCSLVDYRHLYCMVSNSDGNIFCLITSMIVMIKKIIYIYRICNS